MKFKTSDTAALNNPTKCTKVKHSQPEVVSEVVPEINPKNKNRSVIGSNIKFRGELIGTEDIHIEGTIEGTIIMKGHNLSVGTQGAIDANIHANNITIHGKLNGDILADELISIKNSAEVKGNLIAPRIQLDDGGKFRGSMDMVDNEQEKKEANSKFQAKLVHPHLPEKNKVKKETSHSLDASKKLNEHSQSSSKTKTN